MAKLDPDNYKSAQDILDQQQAEFRKRKWANTQEADDAISHTSSGALGGKRLKIADDLDQPNGNTTKQQPEKGTKKTSGDKALEKAEKRRKKQEKRKSKKEKKKDTPKSKSDSAQVAESSSAESFELDLGRHERLYESPFQSLRSSEDANNRSVSPSIRSSPSRSLSSGFDAPLDQSGSSSITSLQPPSPEHPTITDQAQISKEAVHDKHDHNPEELKRRLQARIEDFRTARKANDPQKSLPRSRQELIDSRRQKEELRKAQKKELKKKLKEEEAQKRADTLARGSPLLSPGSPQSARTSTNQFAFGNIEFNDGQKLSADLTNLVQSRKAAKGPSDPATALLAAQKSASRLASLDETKREDIGEKESWLNARKRAQGERIRDDSNLLKKTLKRKQSQKKKSEKEWKERIDGVKKREEIRQKKREANLKQRRDEKGGKGGKKNKGSKARPGFEGSFRAKAPTGKSNK